MLEFTEAHLWAVLSAPFCALYAVKAAGAVRVADAEEISGKPGLYVFAFAIASVVSAAALAASGHDAVGAIILLCGLTYLAVIDLRYLAVPVFLTLALGAAGLVYTLARDGVQEVLLHAAAAFAGWGTLRALDFVFRRLRGRSGLGSGDALIAAALGAWLSFEGMAWSVAIGGAATLFWAACRHAHADRALPLAPGLAIGAFAVVLMNAWRDAGGGA